MIDVPHKIYRLELVRDIKLLLPVHIISVGCLTSIDGWLIGYA